VRLSTAAFLAIALAAASVAAMEPIPAPPVLPTPPPHIRFSGGDGSSCAEAVVIQGASREQEGIRAERWWIFTKNPGAKIAAQDVAQRGGKDLETFALLLPDGGRKTVCIDITSFYGRP
jgi:hypothetical protein